MNTLGTPQVQIYDGTTNPREFERAFVIMALLLDWDDTKQIANIQYFLKSKALRLYTALATKTTVKHVFDELKLKCSDSADVLLAKFYNRSKRSDESYATFASNLQEILMLAMPGLEAVKADSMLRAQLLGKSNTDIQRLINFNKKHTWDEIIEALEATFPNTPSSSSKSEAGLLPPYGGYVSQMVDIKQ